MWRSLEISPPNRRDENESNPGGVRRVGGDDDGVLVIRGGPAQRDGRQRHRIRDQVSRLQQSGRQRLVGQRASCQQRLSQRQQRLCEVQYRGQGLQVEFQDRVVG